MTTLERIAVLTFTDPVPAPAPDERQSLREHMTALYGELADPAWPDGGALVSYHHMARAVVGELGAHLGGVDLVITVDASPDCRHQSFAGPVLADLLPGDPALIGVSEQGVAGPFTALRIAWHHLNSGAARRALIVVMEQSTLPPAAGADRVDRDVAVAMLLGPDGTVRLGLPEVTVTRSVPAGRTVHQAVDPDVDVVVAGAGTAGPPARVPVLRAADGHPCAGVWLVLAELLGGRHDGGRILVTDDDPALPYRCAMTVTRPAGRRAPGRSGTARRHRSTAPARPVPEPVR
ncbi:hypothetical protein ACTOB_003885 [Actinoplanes oblitus]|uniref:Uncharacterized protein n=1 Tax=Actinoplanes oblitus TaxID=3040509 RepID=A0ABY8WTH0_9ACTN|nr:hypothetical protein [Actinoplanes oblitus]WIN00191.1 hypothetical protein ACTOB_003885 [Actinoplanes oblitus]